MKRLLSSLITGGIFFCSSPGHAVLTSVGLDKNQYTSDFMIGDVAVSIIFAESDGTYDPNAETWSEPRKAQVLSEIMAGLDWWTRQNPRSPLRFTYVYQTINTRYEPITRPYYDESLWIPEIMGRLGYTGSRFTSTRNYANALRHQLGTDWAFVVFVVDSLNDTNGKFADGMFAYSYLGGPFTVMTYDNNGYGIANMDVVTAHEVGHVFNALDQYAGASSPYDYSPGYFPTINGNHEYSTIANDPTSIMRGGIRWGLDKWARLAVGWRDSNNNNQDDILDQVPTITTSVQSSAGTSQLTGQAKLNVLPRQNNVHGYGFTVDTISKVQYRVSSGQWAEASATDGAFDSVNERFQVDFSPPSGASAQAVSEQDISVQVVTALALLSGGGTSSSTGPPATTLDNAHAFPNPFKPNSNMTPAHTSVTFTGLTADAKVQIFSPAGEPVFEEKTTSPPGDIAWRATNKSGQKVASGVYFYLITDPQGHKKKGKIAVVH